MSTEIINKNQFKEEIIFLYQSDKPKIEALQP